jgi:hypothetical protein
VRVQLPLHIAQPFSPHSFNLKVQDNNFKHHYSDSIPAAVRERKKKAKIHLLYDSLVPKPNNIIPITLQTPELLYIIVLLLTLTYINNMRSFHHGNSTHMYSIF